MDWITPGKEFKTLAALFKGIATLSLLTAFLIHNINFEQIRAEHEAGRERLAKSHKVLSSYLQAYSNAQLDGPTHADIRTNDAFADATFALLADYGSHCELWVDSCGEQPAMSIERAGDAILHMPTQQLMERTYPYVKAHTGLLERYARHHFDRANRKDFVRAHFIWIYAFGMILLTAGYVFEWFGVAE